MKKKILVLLVCLLVFSCRSYGSVYNLSLCEDTYVISTTPNFSYGSSSNLSVNRYLTGAQYVSYLRFDLRDIPASEAVASARLFLYANDGAGMGGTDAYFVSDDTWQETMTYTSRPSVGPAVLGSNATSGPSATGTWQYWDLALTPEMIANGLLSIALTANPPSSSDNRHRFNSSEAKTNHPYLVVETSPVPLPPAAWLLGSGLVGLIGVRRRIALG